MTNELWSFYDFIDARGANAIKEWRDGVSDAVRAALDAKIDMLHGLSHDRWRRPLVGKLEGHEEVYELRFKEDGTAWRILFCFGPRPGEATFLTPAREVNRRFEPLSAPGTAEERARLVRSKDAKDRKYVAPHDYS